MEEVKARLLTQAWTINEDRITGPPGGLTKAVPRFKDDLAALLSLAAGEQPAIRHIRSNCTLTAYYGFGNTSQWFKEEQQGSWVNHKVRGAHASIPFQCKDCWIFNLERQLWAPELDDMFVIFIHHATVDAMGGRAVTTIKAHTAAIKRSVQNSRLVRKTPTIPKRSPYANR